MKKTLALVLMVLFLTVPVFAQEMICTPVEREQDITVDSQPGKRMESISYLADYSVSFSAPADAANGGFVPTVTIRDNTIPATLTAWALNEPVSTNISLTDVVGGAKAWKGTNQPTVTAAIGVAMTEGYKVLKQIQTLDPTALVQISGASIKFFSSKTGVSIILDKTPVVTWP